MSIYKDPYDEYLCHYGVIGMHWGVRKAANNFYKAGKQYGKYLKQKNRINAINKKVDKLVGDNMLIKDNETELYHSATYLGKDYSDGIKHWKYIKREKVNGRWRYYYDSSSLRKAEKRYDKALNDAAKKSVNDLATAEEYRNEIKKDREAMAKTRSSLVADQLQRRYEGYLKPQYDYYSKGGNQTENEKLDRAIRKAASRLRSERIMSATIGTLAKGTIHGLNAISSGKQKIGKLFKKLFK